MRIVIDARFWTEAGIGRYIRNLVWSLQELDKKNDYFILHLKKDYNKLKYKGNFTKVLADFKWYGATEQLRLPKILYSLNPDLVHIPHFNVPFFYKGKYIVTIHDLIHHHFQMRKATTRDPFTYKIKTIGYGKIFSRAIKNSAKIITPSNFVKKQLIEEYNADKNKISVTYEAAENTIINLAQKNSDVIFKKLRAKLRFNKPYIYYIGNAHPHKNLYQLIKAFEIFKINHPDFSLVLSGKEHYFWQQLKKQTKCKNVIFTGFVSDKEMVALYKNAKAFIMPSLEEGFGIPLLEAMACGCAVISSNTASLPEVGGDAAIYFDPKDENEMAKKITKIVDDEKLRKELIKKGKDRYKEFSWSKMAEQTLRIYKKVVN